MPNFTLILPNFLSHVVENPHKLIQIYNPDAEVSHKPNIIQIYAQLFFLGFGGIIIKKLTKI